MSRKKRPFEWDREGRPLAMFWWIRRPQDIFGRQSEAARYNNDGGSHGALTCLSPAMDSNVILCILNGGSLTNRCQIKYLPGVGGLLTQHLPAPPRPRKRPVRPIPSRHAQVIFPALPWTWTSLRQSGVRRHLPCAGRDSIPGSSNPSHLRHWIRCVTICETFFWSPSFRLHSWPYGGWGRMALTSKRCGSSCPQAPEKHPWLRRRIRIRSSRYPRRSSGPRRRCRLGLITACGDLTWSWFSWTTQGSGQPSSDL